MTIARLEAGKRALREAEGHAIAAACGLPAEWFTADFGRLGEITETPSQISEIKRDLESLRRQIQHLSQERRRQP